MKSLDVRVPGSARSAEHHHTATQASVAIGPLYYDKRGSMPYAVCRPYQAMQPLELLDDTLGLRVLRVT
jgi:hypothetical protein